MDGILPGAAPEPDPLTLHALALGDASVIWKELIYPLGRPWTPEEIEVQQERLAAREREIVARAGQRRWAWPEEFVWSHRNECFYDVMDMTSRSDKGVDFSIPLAHWPRIESKPIKPSAYIKQIDHGQWVRGVVWAPGEPLLIMDWAIYGDGHPFKLPGACLLNLYLPHDRRPPDSSHLPRHSLQPRSRRVPCVVRGSNGDLWPMTRKERAS